MKNRRRGSRRERGYSSMLFILVASVLLATLAAGLIRVATAASVIERYQIYVMRANDNAESAVVRAELVLKQQLGERLRQVAADAARAGTINMRVPVFVGAEFKPMHFDFDFNFPGYDPDERGSADVLIRLAGPPRSKTLAGLEGERKGVMLDAYDFTVEIRGTGTSSMNATAHAIEFATQKVWVLSGPPDSPIIVKANALSTGAVASREPVAPPPTAPAARTTGRDEDQYIPSGAVTIGPISGHVIWSVPPDPANGMWTGDPEVVSGPTRYGYDKGDAVYVYELRGVPGGTRGANPNTTVLATDDWRFSTEYNRGTDTRDYYEGPGHALTPRKGTPWYAIVAVRPPSAGEGLELPLGTGQLVLPGDRVVTLPPVPDGWQSEARRIQGPDGRPYDVTAQPHVPTNPDTASGDGFFVDNVPGPTGTRPQAIGPLVASTTTTIYADGYAQDLATNPNIFGGLAHQYSGTGPVRIPLLAVMARQNQLTVGFASGGTSVVLNNAKHYVFEPDDPPQPGVPPPDGGGCSDCDGPTPTIALIGLMFVGGDIVPVSDAIDEDGAPTPVGK